MDVNRDLTGDGGGNASCLCFVLQGVPGIPGAVGSRVSRGCLY